MQTLLIYILKAIVYSGILFCYYYISLRNNRFHYYNRFYLLMSVAVSLLLPFVTVELWQWQSNNPQVIQLMSVVVTNDGEKNNLTNSNLFSQNIFAMLMYGFITFCLLLSFTAGIIRIFRYKRSYPVEKLNNISIINTNLDQAPFSFFNNLFWKNTIDISDETGRQIFKHELTHIEQKHSWDKVVVRITTLLFWINPFYWLIEKELNLIHEFIADEKAIENKNAEAFALMLLHSQYGKHISSPAQSFHYSPIKRRLLMLTTSNKPSFSYARRLLILPLLAATVLLFAFKLKENKNGNIQSRVNAPFVLVVDAGHGGNDAGAPGSNDKLEKDINLSVAKEIAQLAPSYGITVKMTRIEDATVSLKDRLNFTKEQSPDAFISVHMNVTDEKKTSKQEVNVYITRNDANSNYTKSRLLGSSLLQTVKNDFAVNTVLIQRKQQGIYVIDQNPYPAIIFECGYMNNTNNLKQLMDDTKIERMARDILQGVVAYANADKSMTAITDTTGKTPLYIVDGKEIPAEEVKKMDANNIESVTVLKEASSIKKYGEKGKNGVVLIQMKDKSNNKGKSADTTVDKLDNDITTAPLYIVDGKEMPKDKVDIIPSNEIKAVTVWKSDEAIKRYGEKGKNGVVEVTTGNKKPSKPDSSSVDNIKNGYEPD